MKLQRDSFSDKLKALRLSEAPANLKLENFALLQVLEYLEIKQKQISSWTDVCTCIKAVPSKNFNRLTMLISKDMVMSVNLS